jgi:hypothetical protein
MAEERIEGGCQCGAVRYEVRGAPVMVALCHCSMCRRASAAPAVAWAMFQEAQVRFAGGAPAQYASSAEARRGFCAACGTPVSFTASFIPGLIDITVGSLDHPEAMPPTFHYWDSRRLPWLKLSDDLPRHAELPPTA